MDLIWVLSISDWGRCRIGTTISMNKAVFNLNVSVSLEMYFRLQSHLLYNYYILFIYIQIIMSLGKHNISHLLCRQKKKYCLILAMYSFKLLRCAVEL